MVLKGEYAAQRAISAIFVGMGGSIEVDAIDWPKVREVLVLQATVWESEGKQALADATRATIVRLDAGAPTTLTGMTKEQ